MSAQPARVQATILGQTVTADVVDRISTADARDGIRDVLVLDVDGSRYRVDESDTQPR